MVKKTLHRRARRLDAKLRLIARPVAAATAFAIMPPARRLTERVVALLDGRR